MSGTTEQRLRDATAALGETLRPEIIGDLRLPPRRAAAWRWPAAGSRGRLLIPLAAAAAVLALIGSLIIARGLLCGAVSVRPSHSTSPAPVISPRPGALTTPAFLVTAVQGHGYVRSAATGRVVARIPPPARNLSVEGIAMEPGDRDVYLAGAVPQPGTGRVRLEFFVLTLGRHGRPGPARALPGAPLLVPGPVTSDGLMTLPLAVSPDDRYLAYPTGNQFYPDNYAARHPAAVTVLNLVTGTRRTWTIWPDHVTQITQVSWDSAGRIGIVATIGRAGVSGGRVVARAGFEVSAFLVLDTGTASRSLAAASTVLVADQFPEGNPGGLLYQPVVSGGVLSPDGKSAYVLRTGSDEKGRLAAISTATGRVTRHLLTRPAESVEVAPLAVDGRYLLIALGPLRPAAPRPSYTCGRLARDPVARRAAPNAAGADHVQYRRAAAAAAADMVTPQRGEAPPGRCSRPGGAPVAEAGRLLADVHQRTRRGQQFAGFQPGLEP